MENQDELQKNLETELENIEKKDEEARGLEIAIQEKKRKLYEIGQAKRELEAETEDKFEKARMEKAEILLEKKFAPLFSDLQLLNKKEEILKNWKEKFDKGSFWEEGLEKELYGAIVYTFPEYFEEVIKKQKTMEEKKAEIAKTQQELAQTEGEPTKSEYTPEEIAKAAELGVSPKAIRRMKTGEIPDIFFS